MVARIAIIVFAAAICIPLWLLTEERSPRPYFEGAWSAEELDAAYLDAIASADVKKKRRSRAPVIVAGIAERCLENVPRYDGCNHDVILETVRLCAGSNRSRRLFDSKDYFPVEVGKDARGRRLMVRYSWDLPRPTKGWVHFAYYHQMTEEECERYGGKSSGGRWGPYEGCWPDHERDCAEALSVQD